MDSGIGGALEWDTCRGRTDCWNCCGGKAQRCSTWIGGHVNEHGDGARRGPRIRNRICDSERSGAGRSWKSGHLPRLGFVVLFRRLSKNPRHAWPSFPGCCPRLLSSWIYSPSVPLWIQVKAAQYTPTAHIGQMADEARRHGRRCAYRPRDPMRLRGLEKYSEAVLPGRSPINSSIEAPYTDLILARSSSSMWQP